MRFRTTVTLWLLVSLTAPALSAPPEPIGTWLYFTSKACGHCRVAERFQKTPTVLAASKPFRAMVIDVDKQPELKTLYGVTSTPTDIFLPAKPGDTRRYVYNKKARDATDYAARFATATAFFAAPIEPSYPLRPPGAAHWSGCKDYRHLLTREHAGCFDEGWLSRRPLAEILALHADHHEELLGIGKVKWQYVVRPPPQLVKR